MKKKFSKAWKSSKQPRKQRKYLANAPIHLKRKIMSINLSKELRTKYSRRNIVAKKGDTVKIMRGRFKNKKGKIIEIKIKMTKIFIEGVQVKKQDGSKVNVKLQPSNLQLIELNLTDRKRVKKLEGKSVSKEKIENKKESKK